MSTTTKRFGLIIILFSLFVLLLIAHYFKLMVLNPPPDYPGETSRTLVERGPILDRNGRVLAIQTRLYSVTAWIPNIQDSSTTSEILAEILDLDALVLKERLDTRTGFVYIKRKISTTTAKKIRLLIQSKSLPGISLEPEYGRNYPEENLASHVLGYVGTDNTGLDGIELTYDQILAPPAENTITTGSTRYGNQLFLTLDLNIQYLSESIAQRALEEHKATSVMILVMDAKNGDILGWASAPDFDPNTFLEASPAARQNLPITYAYEPGSVFKIFSIASMLELGLSPNTTFYCNGYYERLFPSDQTVHINCLGNHGSVNASTILRYSCNAAAAYASDTVEKEAFHRQITEFGFGSTTNLPLPGETNGIFTDAKYWSGRTKPTVAIGQEISVSAVQMVTAATALTNGGKLLEPHLVKKVISPDGKILEENTRKPLRQTLRPEVAAEVLAMMKTVTSDGGTAWRARIDGIHMSAKTGTAQKIDPSTGLYSKNAFVASCMAIFPTEDPQLITYVVIDTPGGDQFYGGRIAAPLIKELGMQLISYLGIPTENETVISHSGVVKLPRKPVLSIGTSMPDLQGASKRELLPLLSREDLRFIFKGEGWVTTQYPKPGTPITKHMQIILEFK